MTIMKWSAQLAKALLIAVLLYPAAAMAVGFGEITLKSALNEPLNAEIALTNVDKIEEGMLLVQLASPAAFTQAGVSRDYYLTQLRFAVTASASGDTVVLVTSEAPISEPYLDFLVQLEWPAGRMIREYTLLLDLPIYSGEKGGEKVVAPIQTATAGAPKVRRSTNQLSGSEHRVVVGDTLWNVARRLRPQGLTILQTMDALYTQNPKAFVAGNANNMKKGSILRLPSETDIGLEDGDIVASQIGINGPGQIAAVTSKSATAAEEPKEPKELAEVLEASAEETPQVAEEEQLFPEEDLFPEDDLYSEETVDESADAEGRLELASAYDADGSSNGSNSEPNGQSNGQSNGGSNGLADQNGGVNEVQQLNSELAVAEDEVNKTQLDNNELRERNSLLEAQVSTLATLAEVAEEQAEAVPAKAKPVTKADPTAMEKATKAADSLVLLLEKKPMYAWGGLAALVLLVVILFLWLTRKRTIDVNDFPIRPLPVPPEEVIIDTGADQLIDDAEGGHLNPDESLFDETDKEIFAEEDSKVSKEIFGSMVEAMEEAEVYVSLGDTDGAIRVLERARRVSASDTACRLRLMELLFKEGSTDKLKLIAEEINKTEDEEAMAMAAVIVGDKQEMTLNPASLAVDEKPTLEEPSPFQEPSADDSMFDEEEPSVAQWGESTADEEPSASLNEEPSASPNKELSAALNEEHDPSEENSAADTELTLDEEPSASLNEELSASLNEELSAVLDKEHEPSVAPNEELPEVDSLEELESSGDAAIDELAESVLDEDFLDDSFLDGGIFADVGQATEPKEHKVPEDLGLQVDAEDLPGTADLENSMGDEAAAIAEFMASLDDFDGAEDAEEISSVDVKLDLANTFIEMGDPEGAREILKEIIGEADQAGQARAQLVLETLG